MIKTQKILSLAGWIKKAQDEFNKYIRFRDQNERCISCGGQGNQAGHYYSAGHYSALRYNEVNCNIQCTRCNCFLHGNLIHYRQGLIRKYGAEKIELLDSTATRNRTKKWSRGELQIIYEHYKNLNNGN